MLKLREHTLRMNVFRSVWHKRKLRHSLWAPNNINSNALLVLECFNDDANTLQSHSRLWPNTLNEKLFVLLNFEISYEMWAE